MSGKQELAGVQSGSKSAYYLWSDCLIVLITYLTTDVYTLGCYSSQGYVLSGAVFCAEKYIVKSNFACFPPIPLLIW